MQRSGLAVGGLVVTGGLLWLVAIWPTAQAPHASDSAVVAASPSEEHNAVDPAPATAPARKDPGPKPSIDVSVKTSQQPVSRPFEPFSEPSGPYAEYKTLFAREPRDPAADAAERTIREAFETEAHAMRPSVSCRQTLCRVELRWSTSLSGEYVAAMGRLGIYFNRAFASAPIGPSNPDQTRPIELFLKSGTSRPNPLAQ